MFNRAYEAKLLEPSRIHRLAPLLRIIAELPGKCNAELTIALVGGFHIHAAKIDYRRNHASLENIGAEDVEQSPATGKSPA